MNRESIIKSLEQLTLLGALGDDRKLSDPVGRQMARLPLPPIYSKALIKASELNCLEEMLITVAMLSAGSMFFTPREKLDEVFLHGILPIRLLLISHRLYRSMENEMEVTW